MTTKVTKKQVDKAKLIAGTGPVDVLFAMGLIELIEEEDPVKLATKVAELEAEVIRLQAKIVNMAIDGLEVANGDLVSKLQGEAMAWEETARGCQTNSDYYRGICQQIGQTIGEPAYTADDGVVHDDVLVAKLPELVRDLKGTLEFERKGIARLQAELKQARKDRDHWHRAYQRAIEPVWIEKP